LNLDIAVILEPSDGILHQQRHVSTFLTRRLPRLDALAAGPGKVMMALPDRLVSGETPVALRPNVH
jgi:hypothetical protein